MLPKLLLVVQYLSHWQRCVEPRPSYCDLKIFSTSVKLSFDLYLPKVKSVLTFVMLNICAKFHENRICSFQEITSEQTNQTTNKLVLR